MAKPTKHLKLQTGFVFDGNDKLAVAERALAEKFIYPPFTTLDTRKGWWQARKTAWLLLGIRSEVGRDANLLKMSDTVLAASGNEKAAARRAEKLQNNESHRSIYPGHGQDLLGTPREWQRELKPKDITPGGGGFGKNSAYMLKTSEGYKSVKGIEEGGEEPEGVGSGTSIFDPVLCELAYRWFCPMSGTVLDPFSGGSVRGIVAARLGRKYIGVDLSEGQVLANREQGLEVLGNTNYPLPSWHIGDSTEYINKVLNHVEADFVFSCPPYFNLEVYSQDPRDISNMTWADFKTCYSAAIFSACARLRNNRFACFVVSEVRDKSGNYVGLVPETINAFERAGLRFYNEAILINSAGSLGIRVGRQFTTSRKLGRSHQNVLVFVKGDPRLAVEACGTIDVNVGNLE